MISQYLIAALAAGACLGTPALAQPDRLAIIQAKGDLGDDLTLAAFARATESARSAGVDSLVFVLDSPGGQQRDARLIAQALHDARHDLHIVVCVRRALGEAVWIMAAGEQLLFSPSGASGAAVAYRVNPQTGTPEVDKREIASIAAQVSAMAESNRQPGAVYRAMIDPDQGLWTVEKPAGHLTYSNAPLPFEPGAREWDNASTVLALTARQATDLNLGTRSGDAPADIAAALGYTDYLVTNDPNRNFILATRSVAQARAKLQRESALVTKHTAEFASEFRRFQTLNQNLRYERPYVSPYIDRYDARYRQSYNQFLNAVARYQRSLLEVKNLIDKTADLEKRALKAMKEANRQIETLNGLLGYTRHAPIAANIDASSKAAMETAWRTIHDELEWCSQQR